MPRLGIHNRWYLRVVQFFKLLILFLLFANSNAVGQIHDWKKETISSYNDDSVNYYGEFLPLINSITKDDFEQANTIRIHIQRIGCFGRDIKSYSLIRNGNKIEFIDENNNHLVLTKKASLAIINTTYSLLDAGLEKYRTRKEKESFYVHISNYKTYVYFMVDNKLIKLNQYDLDFNELVTLLNDYRKSK